VFRPRHNRPTNEKELISKIEERLSVLETPDTDWPRAKKELLWTPWNRTGDMGTLKERRNLPKHQTPQDAVIIRGGHWLFQGHHDREAESRATGSAVTGRSATDREKMGSYDKKEMRDRASSRKGLVFGGPARRRKKKNNRRKAVAREKGEREGMVSWRSALVDQKKGLERGEGKNSTLSPRSKRSTTGSITRW